MAGTSGASLNWGGLDRAIERAARRLADRKRLMATVGEALVSGATQRFVDEEDPQGKKWTPSQRAEREGGKTLTDTARLLRSLDYAATSDKVMVGAGSNVKYASSRAHSRDPYGAGTFYNPWEHHWLHIWSRG